MRNQLIPIEPFDAEVEVVAEGGKRVWQACRVVGVKDGSHRFELVVLYPFDDGMMCAMSCDDVRIRPAQPLADAPSD